MEKKSKNTSEVYVVVERHMKSLKEYGLKMYKAYNSYELDILIPNNKWQIPLAGGKMETLLL